MSRDQTFNPLEAKIMLSRFAHKSHFVMSDTPFAILASTMKRKFPDARNKIGQSVQTITYLRVRGKALFARHKGSMP